MQPGYVCVAGIALQSNTHIRPILAGRRLTVALLRREGGPFDVGAEVDLGSTLPHGSPPEVEDHVFNPTNASFVKDLPPRRFWKVLEGVAQADLATIFGPDLQPQGRGCAVDIGAGTASLGCLLPVTPPRVEIDAYHKVRMHIADGTFMVNLSVTDLRFYQRDHKTPRAKTVQDVQRRIASGVGVILSLGLARPWQKPGDTVRRHWLQVNNLHLQDDPSWNEARD
jgi:hypothetical protein